MLKTIAVDKKGNILTEVSLERLKELIYYQHFLSSTNF